MLWVVFKSLETLSDFERREEEPENESDGSELMTVGVACSQARKHGRYTADWK